jgi:hypothetical protein
VNPIPASARIERPRAEQRDERSFANTLTLMSALAPERISTSWSKRRRSSELAPLSARDAADESSRTRAPDTGVNFM